MDTQVDSVLAPGDTSKRQLLIRRDLEAAEGFHSSSITERAGRRACP